MRAKYLNPYTDFRFKKIFGEEINKDLLIDFLNHLIPDLDSPIEDLQYMKNEHLPRFEEKRKAIFDLHCSTEKGDRFIVEIQRAKQEHFRDRSIFYSSFLIQDQGQRGKDWNFKLQKVYTISLLDFELEGTGDFYLHDIQLKDKNNNIFSDTLRYIYLEMPKFKKNINELESHFEKWVYTLQNMAKLEERPLELQEKIFQRVLDVAEIGKLDEKEYQVYQDELKVYWDMNNVINYAEKRGKEEGKEEEKLNTAKKMLQKNYSIEDIMDLTNLTKAQIDVLKGGNTH